MSEKKRKKEKYSKSVCECGCLYLFYGSFYLFMIKLQRINKNLIFWFAHGPELLTYT